MRVICNKGAIIALNNKRRNIREGKKSTLPSAVVQIPFPHFPNSFPPMAAVSNHPLVRF